MVLFRVSNWKICKAPLNNSTSSAGETSSMAPNHISGEKTTPQGDCPRGFHPHTSFLGLWGCSLSLEPEVNAVRRKGKEEGNIFPVP